MLRKIKLFLLIGSVIILIAIVTLLISKSISPKTNIETTPVLTEITTPGISLLTQSDSTKALEIKKTLLPKLPIYIYSFQTSVGITTDIAISSYLNDTEETVRIEIFGLNYVYDQNDPQTNPNMIAFKESFEKVKEIFAENNVNINELHISLGNKKYIRDIAETWIKTLNLLP